MNEPNRNLRMLNEEKCEVLYVGRKNLSNDTSWLQSSPGGHEPVMCLGNKGGQQHLGLYWQKHDLGNDTKHTQRKFTDDAKLGRVVDTMLGRAAIQRDTDRMQEWFNRNLMKVKGKCKVLHLRWKNPKPNTGWRPAATEQLCRKEPKGPGRQQTEHVIAACSCTTCESTSRVLSLALSSIIEKKKRLTNLSRQRIIKRVNRLKHRIYEERVRELGLFRWRKRRCHRWSDAIH
ncbi:hypothetical protein QYF61_013150, partial [Mycteria americana]